MGFNSRQPLDSAQTLWQWWATPSSFESCNYLSLSQFGRTIMASHHIPTFNSWLTRWRGKFRGRVDKMACDSHYLLWPVSPKFRIRTLICIIVGVLLLFRRLKKKHYGVFGNEENCLDEEVEKWRKNKSYLAEASINYCCTYLEKGSHIRNRQNL